MTRTCASWPVTSALTCSSRTSARRSVRLSSRPTATRSGTVGGCSCTEVLLCLALTFGLEDDPPDAVARAIGFVEACGRARGVEYPFQGTIATTNGESLWAFRYSSQGSSRSLFFTRDVRTLRQQHPDWEVLHEVSDDARLVVSEPIGDLPAAWVEMPEASYGVVSKQGDQLLPFAPKPPSKAT